MLRFKRMKSDLRKKKEGRMVIRRSPVVMITELQNKEERIAPDNCKRSRG